MLSFHEFSRTFLSTKTEKVENDYLQNTLVDLQIRRASSIWTHTGVKRGKPSEVIDHGSQQANSKLETLASGCMQKAIYFLF